MPHLTSLDREIYAWYESLSEETLRDLYDRIGASTPRQAWKAFFNDCAFPARQQGDSLAAPVLSGPGAYTGNDMLCGELCHPDGFWVSLHCLVNWWPSAGVRAERRS